MADGSVKIVIEVDGKQINLASKELDNLEDVALRTGKGVKSTESSMDSLGDSSEGAASSVKGAKDSLDDLGDAGSKTSKELSGVDGTIDGIADSSSDATTSVRGAKESLDDLGGSGASVSKDLSGADSALDGIADSSEGAASGAKSASDSLGGMSDSADDAAGAAKKVKYETDGMGEGTKKASVNVKDLAISLGLVKIASTAFSVLKSSLDGAIDRFDTLGTFPKVLESIGVSAEDSERAMDKLANGIEGTTATLDDISSSAQRMYTSFNDMDKATDTALALQRALDGSGASAEKAKRGTEQYIKALQTGTFDMNTWNTLSETMDVGLVKIAESFGYAGKSAKDDLYRALQDGTITLDDFNDKLIEVGTGTGVMVELAKTNSGGLRNELTYLSNAAKKGMADVLESINNLVKKVSGKEISEHISSLRFVVDAAFTAMGTVIEATAPAIILFTGAIKGAIPIVNALTPAIVGLMTAYAAYTIITKVGTAIEKSNAILRVAQASKTGLTLVTKAHTAALAADIGMTEAQTIATIAQSGAVKLSHIVVGILTGKIGLLTAVQTVATAATPKFSAAMTLLSGPVGWVVAGIGLLVAATVGLIKWLNKTSEEAQRLNGETEKLNDATSQLNSTVEGSINSYKESQKEIESSAAANKTLANEIENLSEKENKSLAEKQLLADKIEELNGRVEGLSLSYNAEADALNMSSAEMQDRIGLMEEQTSYNEALERQTEIMEEQHQVQEKLGEINDLREEWNQKLADGDVKSKEYKEAIEILDEQEQELKETNVELGNQYKETEEQMTSSMAAITEATENGVISQMIAFEDLSESQQATVEAMKSTWEDYKDAATDMFDTLNDEVEITASEMAANLEENQRIISEWSENIAILAERGVDEGLLNTLREAGPESAGHVNALVNASDEELQELSTAFKNGGDVATEALSTSLGIEESGVLDAVGHLVTDTESSLKEQIEAADFQGVGNAVPEGLAGGIEDGTPQAEKSSENLANKTIEQAEATLGVHSPSTVFKAIGINITEGLVLGINQGAAKVVQAVQKMFQQVSKSSAQSFTNITRTYDTAINQIDRSLSRLPQITQQNMTNMTNAIMTASKSQISMLKVMTQNYNNEVNNIDKSFKKLVSVTQKSMINMLNIIRSGGNAQMSYMKVLSRSLVTPFNSLPNQFNSIGRNAISGLNAGLNAGRGRVLSTAAGIANSVARTMQNALKIQSPSKVMKDDVGRWIPEGIAEGIEDKASVVYDALNKMNTQMMRFSTPESALGLSGMKANASTIANYNNTHTTKTVNNDNKPTIHIEKIENYTDDDIPKVLESAAWIMSRGEAKLDG